ncbi:tryptophan/threonine-rich antigen [Plasmodium knowlesi strain H]|uniref:Tryptophan/threonine-rich antigen n=3 Tax=Plasmodium knowlesi TaxID=5850 RepID=A0A5K1UJ52_PLAKH|nr:tryptophan-rich antigen [Plasmodium knowlesi strain H]OTN68055.1 Tryptophan/threonine-rich antigen [Plasmodium knowlesi]CAA9987047.1 tryptophan-rich antigen [Plasmodium knowlesi strain H]SBO26730.1 tryptophan/threonine-rich antigen [Plasmodium knowlesi strain H]SBO28253.1 tryptophan/threonine-rich antigen [Plasmodium knowlesi strain H]VVS76521.1 tryptophan-rich antigen [Plasmodium knowlesi strain H]|eukprot:XP_002258292.1 Tryptophan/threonine-rich antigen, putative [Plasmodium knowlesi strain H]
MEVVPEAPVPNNSKSFVNAFFEKYKDSFLANVKREFLIIGTSFIALFLASYIFLTYINSPAKKKLKEVDKTSKEVISKEKEDENIKTDEWKAKEWKKWMTQLDSDAEIFTTSLNHKKDQWIAQRELEWGNWIKSMEEKWNYYNERMGSEYYSFVFKNTPAWTDEEWENWIKTEAKELMEIDWSNWISESESYVDVMLVKEWIQWKNNKIMEWITKDWKCKEEEQWDEWEKNKWPKWLSINERKKWTKWKDRLSKETEEWIAWVENKEKQYLDNEDQKLSEWKKNTYTLFNKWRDSYINKFIKEKQWKNYFRKASSIETPASMFISN